MPQRTGPVYKETGSFGKCRRLRRVGPSTRETDRCQRRCREIRAIRGTETHISAAVTQQQANTINEILDTTRLAELTVDTTSIAADSTIILDQIAELSRKSVGSAAIVNEITSTQHNRCVHRHRKGRHVTFDAADPIRRPGSR